MNIRDRKAARIRERLWDAGEDHFRATQDRAGCPPVSLSRDEFVTLTTNWWPIRDGDPPIPDDAGVYWWRDVPFTVRRTE